MSGSPGVRPRVLIVPGAEGPAPTTANGHAPSGSGSAASVPDIAREQVIFDVEKVSVLYGQHRAIEEVTLPIYRNLITAVIGPSG